MNIRHSIIINFSNKPGAIIRIALILERRGFIIETLETFPSFDGYSQMLLTVKGSPEKFEQILKQLSKLIDVISAEEKMEKAERMEGRMFSLAQELQPLQAAKV
jgi:acetolactate synthase I/III small subunit